MEEFIGIKRVNDCNHVTALAECNHDNFGLILLVINLNECLQKHIVIEIMIKAFPIRMKFILRTNKRKLICGFVYLFDIIFDPHHKNTLNFSSAEFMAHNMSL